MLVKTGIGKRCLCDKLPQHQEMTIRCWSCDLPLSRSIIQTKDGKQRVCYFKMSISFAKGSYCINCILQEKTKPNKQPLTPQFWQALETIRNQKETPQKETIKPVEA